jgi:hypothetical protein
MAVDSLKHGYIFFANPQTASKAISRTLERELEGEALHKRLSQEQKAPLKKLHHLTYGIVVEHELLPRDELDGLVRVTGIRNPYDLMVSRYLKHRERFTNEAERYKWVRRQDKEGIQRSVAAASEKSFPEWIQAQYGSKRTAKGYRQYLDHADAIIRFEAIQEDFDALLRRIGVDWPITVQRENVTTQRASEDAGKKKRSYADFYDDDSRALIGRLFEPVIDRFGYRFDG